MLALLKPMKKCLPNIPVGRLLLAIWLVSIQSVTVFGQDTLFVFNLDSSMQINPRCYTNYGTNTSAYGYDFMKMATVLQGIVNRQNTGNKIFCICNYTKETSKPENFNPDEFWLSELSQPSQYLSTYTQVHISPDSFYTQLLPDFKDMVKGIVLWSDSIPATSNVASTICGVDDYLPALQGGELDSELVKYLGNLPAIDLATKFSGSYATIPGTNIPTTGSKKCDVYLWAMNKYINTGEVNPTCVDYTVDAYSTLRNQDNQIMYEKKLNNRGLINADYYVANRSFFVDLDPRDTSMPNDDPSEPLGTDYRTFQEILSALRTEADTSVITIGGFVPWMYKYTNGTQADAVHAEWSQVDLFSAYYAQLDAGNGGPANASIYEHVPLDQNLKQNNDQGQDRGTYSRDTNYVCFYMGDYDSGAWTSDILPALWMNGSRGTIPLAWGLDPGLSRRIPQAFNYYYQTVGKNDYFVSGDNGNGYLNAIDLPAKYVPFWCDYQQKLFKQFDLSIAGFVITGFSSSLPSTLEAEYTKFAPNGVGVQTVGDKPLVNGVPFVTVHDLGSGASPTASKVEQGLYKLFNGLGTGNVLFVRTVLASAAALANGVAMLTKDYPALHLMVIDPYTAFRYYEPATGLQNWEGAVLPKSFKLFQNYPNPFNPSTTITYDIPETSRVKIVVYDVLGRKVATLFDGIRTAGRYSINWNAMRYSSGVYLSQIVAQSLDCSKDFVGSRKMLSLK